MPNSPAAKKAEKVFNKLMNKGYVGGKRMADGSLKRICKFDHDRHQKKICRAAAGRGPSRSISRKGAIITG
jgi:hypothetical protein